MQEAGRRNPVRLRRYAEEWQAHAALAERLDPQLARRLGVASEQLVPK
jgi:hypothetical protein